MVAIISDIHGNLEAFQAVLEDIKTREVEQIYCLGDIIGYGPNPKECLDLAEQCNLSLMGNHDEAVLFEPKDFNLRAEMAVEWTRNELTTNTPDEEEQKRRWSFLKQLVEIKEEDGVMYAHGSPRKPLREYIFPRDINDRRKISDIFSRIQRLCFVGHTHVPGVFTEDLKYAHPSDLYNIYMLDPRKTLFNVGSVGQPRDGNKDSCYCTFDGDSVVFRRVPYDVETTVQKIYSIPSLDDSLGDRLREGR
ncbi:MAG: metallophosphoesterase family protein [Planctomycetota bacterium]|nr:metallophosphoesterase family protein [Planctomycetota bacterium]